MTTDFELGSERCFEEARERRPVGLSRREWLGHGLFGLGFLVAAGALALLAPSARELSVPMALALVVAYSLASTIEFDSGAGYGVPAQIVFVPMLLLLPTPLVPALVALALGLSAALQAVLRRQSWGRIVLAPGDAWFSLAPALVLVVAGAQTPEWRHWPVYLLALAAQFVADALISSARMWTAIGLRPRQLRGELVLTYRVDALLAPVGLLATFTVDESRFAPLLLLPLVGVFLVFAREREERVERTLELSRAYRGTALLLHDVLEEKDEYTGRHSEHVVALSVEVAEDMGVDEETRRSTELGALLHDIGKIAIPPEVLNKPGPLDPSEWDLMRTHTVVGEQMLRRVDGPLKEVGQVIRASHERWDGQGYPDQLAAEEIPLAARIVAACDTYNAMITDRPYRRALGRTVALRELRQSAGSQLDPRVVETLVSVLRDKEDGASAQRRGGGHGSAGGRDVRAGRPLDVRGRSGLVASGQRLAAHVLD